MYVCRKRGWRRGRLGGEGGTTQRDTTRTHNNNNTNTTHTHSELTLLQPATTAHTQSVQGADRASCLAQCRANIGQSVWVRGHVGASCRLRTQTHARNTDTQPLPTPHPFLSSPYTHTHTHTLAAAVAASKRSSLYCLLVESLVRRGCCCWRWW